MDYLTPSELQRNHISDLFLAIVCKSKVIIIIIIMHLNDNNDR